MHEDPPQAPPIMRGSCVRKCVIVKYGRTPQCKGCLAMRLEKVLQGCRARIVEQLEHLPATRMRVDRVRAATIARHIE